jgi:hypothetical protein
MRNGHHGASDCISVIHFLALVGWSRNVKATVGLLTFLIVVFIYSLAEHLEVPITGNINKCGRSTHISTTGVNPMFGEWQKTFRFAPVPYGRKEDGMKRFDYLNSAAAYDLGVGSPEHNGSVANLPLGTKLPAQFSLVFDTNDMGPTRHLLFLGRAVAQLGLSSRPISLL